MFDPQVYITQKYKLNSKYEKKSLSKYSQVRFFSEVFIVRIQMMQLKFNFDGRFIIYNFFSVSHFVCGWHRSSYFICRHAANTSHGKQAESTCFLFQWLVCRTVRFPISPPLPVKGVMIFFFFVTTTTHIHTTECPPYGWRPTPAFQLVQMG